jgi:hypothetical protein
MVAMEPGGARTVVEAAGRGASPAAQAKAAAAVAGWAPVPKRPPAQRAARPVPAWWAKPLQTGMRAAIKPFGTVAGFALLVFVLPCLWGGGLLFQVSRVLGSGADVVAGASGVIVGAVTAGTDAARSVADISVAALRSSTAWGTDLWVGVELIDTRIQRAAGRLVADDYLQIMAFLNSPTARTSTSSTPSRRRSS